MGQEAGYIPVHVRTLYDAGVDVSYATDTTFNASAALAHELKSLNLVFSVPDLIKIMGPNSARFINKEKDLRTIEVRKLGDLVILVGNPFEGYWNLLTAVVVVRNGEIMADKRGQPNAGKPIIHGYSSSSLGLRFESGELRPRFVDREVQERDSDQFARFTLEVDPAEPRPAPRGRQVARKDVAADRFLAPVTQPLDCCDFEVW